MRPARPALARSIAEGFDFPTTRLAPSAPDELAKFAALHDQGILSDEEWAATKARLLGL
jgi:hypothetical protein